MQTLTPAHKPQQALTQLLADLKAQDIHVWVEGERLRYRAPKGSLTPELRDRLVAHKANLLSYLSKLGISSLESAASVDLPKACKTTGSATLAESQPHTCDQTISSNVADPFPLTDLQQAYALGRNPFFELGNVSAHYYVEIEAQHLNLDRLNQALQQLIQRHQALQSIIRDDGQQQLVQEIPLYEVEVVDLQGQHADAIEAQLTEVRQRFANQGPSIDSWPLFETLVHQLDEQTFLIHFSISLVICDALSSGILFQELFTLYKGALADLPPLGISCRDYAIALHQHKQSTAYQQAKAYWWQRLDTLPTAPELPLAKQPSTLEVPHFKRWSDRLTPEQWQNLKLKSADQGIKPASLLCSAYATVLNAWTRSSHFCLNVLYFNRLPIHPDAYRVMGNFSSTLLLEVDCTAGADFATQAQTIQRQLWQDLEHSAVSGVEVLGELNRRQGGSSRAAMPVTFASALGLDRGNDSQNDMAQVMKQEWALRDSGLQTPFVLLDHQVMEDQGALILNWDAVDAVFPDGLMDAMFTAYRDFLIGLAEGEELWHQRPHLVPEEQLQLQQRMNDTAVPVSDLTLHGLFQNTAQQHPQKTAIVAPQRNLTYIELDQESTHIAHWLKQQGARVGQQIAIVMDKGWEQAVAALAILKSGAAYLPIDPKLPSERLNYLLSNSDVSLVLTQSWVKPQLTWPDTIQICCVDQAIQATDKILDPHPVLQSITDLAYVIYTSGSTGNPKGVMIDHRGAVNTILDINRRFDITESDRIFAISSLSFDLSVYDLFGTFAAGATLVFPAAESLRDPAHWSDVMLREQVTVWNSAPPLMKLMMEAQSGRSPWLPSSLRRVLLSGDWIPLNLPILLQEQVPNVEVISLGGATEASIWSIFYPIDHVDPDWKSIPYGRPLANQTFHVLDDHLAPCPIWVPGQLFIGGLGLALGYWQNSEKTASSFIDHPQLGRLYRTGDLGRYRSDGNIEFLGREDFQVKVRGYRIELGEIEAALIQHPTLQSVVVMAIPNEQGEKQLVAYGVPEPGCSPDSTDLRQFLLAKLPDYMVPATFIYLDALPVTRNGKLDRKALPRPDATARIQSADQVLPRSPLEQELAELWQTVLGLPQVGVTDNFFELGGSSISAVHLMTQLATRLGYTLPLSTLFHHSTIEQLAQALEQQNPAKDWSCLVPLQTEGTQPPLFLVHPVGGNVFCYNPLVKRLETDRPIYGLQSLGLNPQHPPVTSIEEMAQQYLAAIRTVQLQGPYHLGGWSFGTIVAYEMAQQLRHQGEEVSLLVSIDCAVPDRSIQFDEAYFVAWFIKDLQGRADINVSKFAAELRNLSPDEQLKQILTQAQTLNLVSPDDGLAQIQSLYEVFKANLTAMYQYVPQPYGQDLILLRAEHQAIAGQPVDLGWGDLVQGGVTTHTLPGDHYTIFREPHLQHLVQHLQAVLSQVTEC